MTILAHHYHQAWEAGPQTGGQIFNNPSQTFARFASPWTSEGMVQDTINVRQMMDFGLMLSKFDPTFRQGIRRVISYFLTDIEFFDPTHTAELKEEDINSYREVLHDQLRIKAVLRQALEELCFLGNSLMSILPPIQRRLQCPKCKIVHPVGIVIAPDNPEFKFKYHAKGVRFEATCQKCKHRGIWDVYNIKADFRRNVNVLFWNPKEFILHHDPFTDRRLYTWQIPGDVKKRVNNGDHLLLESMPLSLLQAIGDGKDYLFNDQMILHLREPSLSGLKTGGWGVPLGIYGYGLSRYVFGLRKMNEVLAADYMLPLRVCSPERAPDSGGYDTTDTAWSMDMSDWNSQIRSMIAAHRRDPASIHTIGYPIKYQVLGAEGKSLLPGEIMIQGEDMQLNAMGIPPEFYRGNLNLQVAPMAARLFEQHWQTIVESANLVLSWVVSKITPELGWKACGVRLEPSKIADNMDQLLLMLQMVQAGAVAQSTVLRKLGLDKTEEARKQMDEAMTMAKLEAEQQQELDKLMAGGSVLQQIVDQQRMAMDPAAQQAMAQGGGMGAAPPVAGTPGGAVPPAADPLAAILAKIEQFGSPDTPVSISDMNAVAEEAAAIFATLPEVEKRQKLRDIAAKNPPMKDLITKKMTEYLENRNRQAIAQDRQAMSQGM